MNIRQFSISVFLTFNATIVHLSGVTVPPDAQPAKVGAIAMLATVCMYIVVRSAIDRYHAQPDAGKEPA